VPSCPLMTNPALSKVGRSLTYRSFQREFCNVFAIRIPGVKGLEVGTRRSESEHGPRIARLRLPAVEHTAGGSRLLVFVELTRPPVLYARVDSSPVPMPRFATAPAGPDGLTRRWSFRRARTVMPRCSLDKPEESRRGVRVHPGGSACMNGRGPTRWDWPIRRPAGVEACESTCVEFVEGAAFR